VRNINKAKRIRTEAGFTHCAACAKEKKKRFCRICGAELESYQYKFGETAKLMRSEWSGMSKAALSLAENTRRTGVMLCPAAMRTLCEVTGAPKRDRRKTPVRWMFRVTESQNGELNACMEDMGYTSKNDFAKDAVFSVLEDWKKRKAAEAEALSDLSNTHTYTNTAEGDMSNAGF